MVKDKVSKEHADYREPHEPRPRGERCAGCTMFIPGNSCRTVRGYIKKLAWCRYFEKED